jgi:hypothetical protein
MPRILATVVILITLSAALLAGAETRAVAAPACSVQDWSAARRRAEEAFRKALRAVFRRKRGKHSPREIEQIVRREARRQAQRHISQARENLARTCKPSPRLN